jgi:hypothetical protein
MEYGKELLNGLKEYRRELLETHKSNEPAIKALAKRIKELEKKND